VVAKDRSCGCGHEQSRHEHRTGACMHGCGCAAFHSRRWGARRTFVSPQLADGEVKPEGTDAVALAALGRAGSALGLAAAALNAADKALRSLAPRRPGGLLADRAPRAARPAFGKTKGERAILIAVAQHPDGVTREQLTVLTGYKRSSRDTYLQRLRSSGHVEDGDRIRVTPDGKSALGSDYRQLPTGPALVEHWRQRLPGGELAIFEVVLRLSPVTREAISASTGYKRSSRDTYLQRLKSRELIRFTPEGDVEIHELLRAS
jgi:hypothetical protein